MSISVMVTGGTGFLGRAVVRYIASQGWEVRFGGRNLSIGKALAKETGSIFVPSDLSDLPTLTKACQNVEIVCHTAALSSPWGKYADFHKANVQGTANVIAACQAAGVRRLVHISTPSLYAQARHQFDLTEESPLAPHPANAYAATKLEAEGLVNNAKGLETVILRPRGIFGEGDTSILPRLLTLIEKGPLRLPHGGNIQVELTHVDNVVHAIYQALTQHAAKVSGQTLNITNGEPMLLRDILQIITTNLGMPLSIQPVPYPLAWLAAATQEVLCNLNPRHPEPRLTRYTLGLVSFSQTFNLQKAYTQLGYKPPVSLRQGLQYLGKPHA